MIPLAPLILRSVLEVRHLRLLEVLARCGSMSAAARELGYSQSAITQQVQAIERLLKTPMIIRARGGVRLTSAGQVIVRHALDVLPSISLAEAEVKAVAALRGGEVRLACFPSAAATVLPRALGAMRQEHPDLSFTLTEAEPPRALDLLRRGECDIAVVYRYVSAGRDIPGPTIERDEVVVQLVEEEVHVAMPADHPAASRRWVELRALADSRWIAGCPECRGNLVDSCAAAGFTPDIAFVTDDFVALQALAAEGLGVALVPDLMLAAARPHPRLLLKRLSPIETRVVTAMSTESLMRVPGVYQTVTALRQSAEELTLRTVV